MDCNLNYHLRQRVGSFGGKDAIPLCRDATTERPNITEGLLGLLTTCYATPVTPENFAAYAMAVLAHPGYRTRFTTELVTPGPRVLLTADADLFTRARDLGRRLLWLTTHTGRYRDPSAGRGGPLLLRLVSAGLGWATAVQAISANDHDVNYDESTRTLQIGAIRVTGVGPEVWAYSISGTRC